MLKKIIPCFALLILSLSSCDWEHSILSDESVDLAFLIGQWEYDWDYLGGYDPETLPLEILNLYDSGLYTKVHIQDPNFGTAVYGYRGQYFLDDNGILTLSAEIQFDIDKDDYLVNPDSVLTIEGESPEPYTSEYSANKTYDDKLVLSYDSGTTRYKKSE